MKLAAPTSLLALALLASGLGACRTAEPEPLPPLARSRIAADYASYELRRVGLVPFRAGDLDPARARELREALQFELSRVAGFEVVPLDEKDVAEVDRDLPFQRGEYRARSISELSRRFRLDGLLFGTVTHLEPYAPQSIGLGVELVASETGLVIWSSALELDAADARARESLERYSQLRRDGTESPSSERTTLLSPSRLMRFAACEIARTL
jgi:hypothetical protein